MQQSEALKADASVASIHGMDSGSDFEALSNSQANSNSAAQVIYSDVLKMRCPKCTKLYSVQAHQMHQGRASFFKCIGCSERFAAKMELRAGTMTIDTFEIPADSGVGVGSGSAAEVVRSALMKVPLKPAPISELRCPKCGSRNSLSSSECRFCGVVYAKFNVPVETGGVASAAASESGLAELWQAVMSDYESEVLHERFISACRVAGELSFASAQYSRILKVSPSEEIAKKMRARVVAFASARFEVAREPGGWSFRVPKLNSLIIFGATMLFVIGSYVPGLKSLAGLGVAMMALGLGVHFFLRPARF